MKLTKAYGKGEKKMKKGIILLIISLIFFSLACAEEDFDAKSSAESLYSTVNKKTGSPESLMKNFVNPLLGNGTLYNIEGSKSFQATLVCPSSQRFLEILMQPQETGDTNFFVYYDTNFDGNFDGSYAFTGVSGICSNGFIKCDAGTWQNCKYYKVTFDGTHLLGEETSFADLTSCFCINNACGNNLVWKNRDYVLSTFGGVVVSALQSFDPHYAVTKTEVQDVVIRYYGQDTTKCSYSPSTVAGTTRPEIYFGNPYQMASDAQSQLETSEFTQLFLNLRENLSEKTCTVRRVIVSKSVSWQDIVTSSASQNCPQSFTPQLCGDACVQLKLPIYIQAGGSYSATLNVNLPASLFQELKKVKVSWCTQTTGPYPCTDDDGWYRYYVNDVLVASGSYGDSEDCGVAPNGGCWHGVEIASSYFHEGSNTIKVVIGGAGGGEGVQAGCRLIYFNLYFNILVDCYVEKNYVEDNCVDLRNNPECYLKDRVIDGVYIVRNGENTGLVPITTCQEICGLDYCYNDWTIEEHYLCKNTLPDFDFTRPQEVLSTVRYDSSLLTFNDVRQENGTWVSYPDQQVSLTLEKGEGCLKVCKVKVSEDFTEVGSGGPVSYTSVFPVKATYDIRECVNGTCPYDPAKGEELVKDCACLSEFHDAMVSLQAVRLAGEDITCSSGVKKTLPGW